jgi:hypothetical protein
VLVGEVAPLLLEPVVVPLAMLAALIVAFGLVYFVEQIVRALFGTASGATAWIPWVGSKVQGSLHSVERRLTSALGHAEAAIDKRMGRYFSSLGDSLAWLVREVRAHSSLLWTLSTVLLGTGATAALRGLVYAATKAVAALRSELHRIGGTVASVSTGTLPALRRWTVSHVHRLEHAIDDVIPRDIRGLRARLRAAEDAATATLARLGKLERLLGASALAGALAVALGRLGLGWVRCSNVSRVGKSVCGMDTQLLESLLADALIVAGTLSLVEFAEEMQGVTELAVRPVSAFWRADG